MSLTKYALNDERAAAKTLGMSEGRLRQLRERGKGPQCIELPSGEIRYRLEDLHTWAASGAYTGVVYYYGESCLVLPYPGVKVRRRLPPDKLEDAGSSARPGRERRGRQSHQRHARECLDHEDHLTNWEINFLHDIAEKHFPLSEKQHACLGRIIAKINGLLAKKRRSRRKRKARDQ